MIKSKSVYVLDTVDNIIHIIESLIEFNSHTTDLYYFKYRSKEYEDCSLQSQNCIKKLVKTNKPFGVGYMFNPNSFKVYVNI